MSRCIIRNSLSTSRLFCISILAQSIFILSTLIFSAASAEEALSLSGASTIQPIIEQSAASFEKVSGIELRIEGGGSGTGIRNTLSGTSDIGMVSRKLSDEEKSKLSYQTIGLDTLVVIVNERNPLYKITKSQLADLYTGRTADWNEPLGFNEPVTLVNKEIGRSTLDIFEEYSGLKHPDRKDASPERAILRTALEIGSNLEALTLVGGIPGAIGYVSLGTAERLVAQGMPIRILELDNVPATRETIVSGRYPIGRELNVVFLDKTLPVSKLLGYLLSPEGQKFVIDQGFVPVR